MLRIIVRVFLTAILFCFVFPSLANGVHFNGEFWPEGVIYAGVFALLAQVVNFLIRVGLQIFSVATFGIGLLIVVPLVLFGFWLVPAIQLEVFAHYFPAHFTVDSWGSAIWAGLLLMVVNVITSAPRSSSSSES